MPPDPIAVKAPELYTGKPGGTSTGGIEDICKIDPAACPNLDMEKGKSRVFKETLYNIQQTAPAGEILLTGPLSGAPVVRSSGGGSAGASVVARAPAAIPVKPVAAARAELFDIEAKIRIEVADIEPGRKKLTALVRAHGGQVMNEAVQYDEAVRGASLSLRVPSERVHAFLERLAEIGVVRSSTLETNEVSRKIADAEVIVRNLERVLSRNEELLAKAVNVNETMAIEAELARVRTELDRVRGDLEWAKDRVARSTVYVTLALASDHEPVTAKAKLHPGLRAALFYDVLPSDTPEPSTAYAGGGLSIAWPRRFSLDLDLMTSLRERRGDAIDFYIATVGTDLYSDFFGDGRRSFLNPYIGFRTGFAHAPNQLLFPVGGTLGLDLYKSTAILFAFETRAYALVGRDEGVDFGLEPSLGLNIAY